MIIKPSKKKLYWNIVSEKEMNKMLKIARKDYKKAVNDMPISDYTKDYILNEKLRGKKIIKLIKGKNKVQKPMVLDIGAGFGGVSIPLAREFNVTSVDVNPYTLQFIEYRAKQENINIKTKQIEQLAFGLPFKDNSFDVIVMIGVLEWVACGVKGNVEKIQENILLEVNRILKKGGLFVFGIENRFAWDWMKGKTSHTPIKYIDLMPRKIADIACLKKRGEKYRTYIYGKIGYKKLLDKTNFKDIQFYTAYPTYQKPKRISKNLSPFVNSFIIFSRK